MACARVPSEARKANIAALAGSLIEPPELGFLREPEAVEWLGSVSAPAVTRTRDLRFRNAPRPVEKWIVTRPLHVTARCQPFPLVTVSCGRKVEAENVIRTYG